MTAAPTASDLTPGRPVVFRNATVLTMDDAHRMLRGADLLITPYTYRDEAAWENRDESE